MVRVVRALRHRVRIRQAVPELRVGNEGAAMTAPIEHVPFCERCSARPKRHVALVYCEPCANGIHIQRYSAGSMTATLDGWTMTPMERCRERQLRRAA